MNTQTTTDQHRASTLRGLRTPPAGSRKVTHPGVDAEVYVADGDRPTARAFRGRSTKPAFSYWFRTTEQRDAYVSRWFQDQADAEARKEARKAERQALSNHTLPVDTILVSSWGWEQTNVDFYKVIGHKGTKTLVLVRVASDSVEGSHQPHGMADMCIADPDTVVGEPFEARMRCAHSVTFTQYKGGYRHYARKWDGTPNYRSWYG